MFISKFGKKMGNEQNDKKVIHFFRNKYSNHQLSLEGKEKTGKRQWLDKNLFCVNTGRSNLYDFHENDKENCDIDMYQRPKKQKKKEAKEKIQLLFHLDITHFDFSFNQL